MDYDAQIEFEWDELTSEACFVRRNFDFEFAAKAFADPNRLVLGDLREDYGEPRFELSGAINGRLYIVVFTWRAEKVRIISARKANRREVARYGNRSNEDRHEDAGDSEDWTH